MTKSEFIQRAAISMASKVIGSDGTTDNKDWGHMVIEAEDLACIIEERGYGFDDESVTVMCDKDIRWNIADGIKQLNEAFTEGEHSVQNRLGQIATDNGIETAVEKISETMEKLANEH